MMAKSKKIETKEQIIKRLNVGDRVLSASGKLLTVSLVVHKSNRTIIIFDGDMEIDFDPYFRVNIAV